MVSFDLQSINTCCYAATENGLVAPAVNCTIVFTGTKAEDGKTVQTSFDFGVGNKLGIATKPVVMQKKSFAANDWSGLSSFTAVIQKAVVPAIEGATVQMGSDDFEYVVYVPKK